MKAGCCSMLLPSSRFSIWYLLPKSLRESQFLFSLHLVGGRLTPSPGSRDGHMPPGCPAHWDIAGKSDLFRDRRGTQSRPVKATLGLVLELLSQRHSHAAGAAHW